MRQKLFVLAAGIVLATASMLAFGQHATPRDSHQAPFPHAACAQDSATAKHVPDHLASLLDLSQTQAAEIERLAGEACRIHQEILKVLTPEQQAKLASLHAGGEDATGLHAWFKKLHGG